MLDRQQFLKKMAEIGHEPTTQQLEKCDHYAAKLAQWNERIKLIGPATKDPAIKKSIGVAMLIPFFALIINAIVNGKSAVSNNKSNLSWYDNFVNPTNNCSISNLIMLL